MEADASPSEGSQAYIARESWNHFKCTGLKTRFQHFLSMNIESFVPSGQGFGCEADGKHSTSQPMRGRRRIPFFCPLRLATLSSGSCAPDTDCDWNGMECVQETDIDSRDCEGEEMAFTFATHNLEAFRNCFEKETQCRLNPSDIRIIWETHALHHNICMLVSEALFRARLYAWLSAQLPSSGWDALREVLHDSLCVLSASSQESFELLKQDLGIAEHWEDLVSRTIQRSSALSRDDGSS